MVSKRLAPVIALVIVCATGASAQDSGDLILYNAYAYTLDEKSPIAQAVVIQGDEIVYVGDDNGADAFRGSDTRAMDLGGRLLLPGFVESHFHLLVGGALLSGLTLEMSDDVADIQRKVKEYAEAHPEKKTILAAPFNAFLFDTSGPNRQLLDEVVPDRPVYLLDPTLHNAWVNSKALEVAGITRETPDPSGGSYARDENGDATGFIKGGPAHVPVAVAIDAVTPEGVRSTLPALLDALSAYGFTSLQDMGNPIATEASFDAVMSMDEAGDLPLRVALSHSINIPEQAADAVETLAGWNERYRSAHVKIDALKILADSVVESQKAWMLEPYPGTEDRGVLTFDPPTMKKLVIETGQRGFRVFGHVVGDGAVRELLDAAQAARESGLDEMVIAAHHAQVVHPDDRPRFAEYDVMVQTTPIWAALKPDYPGLMGEERDKVRQMPFRSWADSGVTIALGSDFPAVEGGLEIGVNPFNNIYSAMHRRVPSRYTEDLGNLPGSLPPLGEVLTLAEAVAGYTLNGARMIGIDDRVGSIEVGKKADLVLLDRNLFAIEHDEIPDTRVVWTMMDGKFTYRADP